MAVNISQIVLLVAGAILIFIAPKLVGTVLKILGLALILVGAVIYKFPTAFVSGGLSSTWTMIVEGLPAIAGVGILTVGKGMAKMAVRVSGLLLIIAALASMGII